MTPSLPALAVSVLGLLFSTQTIAGETIVFDGTNPSLLATDPLGYANSLFPHASLSNNTVSVINGVIDGAVYGGVTAGSSDVTGNRVNLSGGTVNGATIFMGIIGGNSVGGKVMGNSVLITGGTVNSTNVYGGVNDGGNAADNKIDLVDGIVTGDLVGGYTNGAGAGEAIGNSVNMFGGTVSGNIFGGQALGASGGNAVGNSITLGGGTVNGNLHAGHSEGIGNNMGNSVAMTAGTVNGDVYGAVNLAGNDIGNSVNLSGGMVNGDVYGARNAYIGNSTDNSVTVTSGTITGNIYGAHNWSGNNTGDHVTIKGGSVGNNIYGGHADEGIVASSSVTMIGGSVGGNVYGGHTDDGIVTGSSVNISGGNVVGATYGGYSSIGNVTDNRITVSGGTLDWNLYGGFSAGSGEAVGNHATITDGTINGEVYGASSEGSADGNSVTITGGTLKNMIYGGRSFEGKVTSNRVSISGGLIRSSVYGGASDNLGFSDITLTDNSVVMTNGTVAGELYGAFAWYGEATGNSVSISGGSVDGYAFGADIGEGDVKGNNVTMTDGSVGASLYGGHTGMGNATGNSVSMIGGSVGGNLYGGFTYDGEATQNIVTIGRGAMLAPTALLGGGFSDTGADAFTDNVLNIKSYQGTVSSVQGFEYYKFTLPANIANGERMLTVIGSGADLTDGTGIGARGSAIDMNIMGGGRTLQPGDKFILIDASTSSLTTNPDLNRKATVQKGFSLLYDFDIYRENDTVVATLIGKDVKTTPQTKALSEGRLSGLAFVNQGGDLVAGQGMDIATAATITPDALSGHLIGFGVISGGSSRYDIGSHVNVDGVSLMTGLAWNAQLESNRLILAPFFEAGWGNYDSYNAFSNAPSVKGSGNTDYYGGGLLARYDLMEGSLTGLYAEGSLRAGRSSTDFSSNDMSDPSSGQRASYDSSSAYYGAHAGLGYVFPLTEKISMDIFTKYLWAHQNSDSVTVVNDPVTFKSSDSHRWRNGARINFLVTEHFSPYVGAAYEYEFDGKEKATAYGYDINTPSLKGGSGLFELGMRVNPGANNNLSLYLAVQGYAGVREGVAGRLDVTYRF